MRRLSCRLRRDPEQFMSIARFCPYANPRIVSNTCGVFLNPPQLFPAFTPYLGVDSDSRASTWREHRSFLAFGSAAGRIPKVPAGRSPRGLRPFPAVARWLG